ncbi:DUF2634 domain-containing protein [Desulforamulus aquiferis]|uniref:DUF2634 domain-containing protein n=1 Tax=Desulforamulus aquiferis TaxID=1397668 RepID=A0AAW7ZBP1_9FIRM|nr:DUF2634 domain-containing protein [Desulforamulus aquiferis]MDO7787118.1 DUF2634 domain-containing protein [Desulforamulus aquiferis]
MPLEPSIQIPQLYQGTTKPSKTYALDFKTGEIKGKVDGRDAIKQFILKAIKTARYRHLIYSSNYGCEIEELIGRGFTGPFMEAEIMRVTTEAIIYDERITRVYDFKVSATGDQVEVMFSVETPEGVLKINEVI